MKPSIDAPYSYRFGEGQPASGRPSIGRRMFRTLSRFSIAVLIGVGATLGWQSYGDEAKEMLVAQVPTLGWVLSVSTTKSPVVAATSTDPMQQLAPLASNLDVVRRSVEQLAAKQEQMAQNIAALRAAEENFRQKMSSTPPAPAEQAAAIPQPKPPQPRAQSSAVQSSSVPRPPPPAGPQISR
jgi:TolA-binding protein